MVIGLEIPTLLELHRKVSLHTYYVLSKALSWNHGCEIIATDRGIKLSTNVK